MSIAIGCYFPATDVSGSIVSGWMSPGLLAVVGYSGAIFGFLQAILIFSTQSKWLGGFTLQPLTSFVARQYNAFESLALTGGLAIANIVTAHLCAFLLIADTIYNQAQVHAMMLAMILFNIILIPTSTALSLRLLAKIFSEAASGNIVSIVPILRPTMARALQHSLADRFAANLFGEILVSNNLKYDPFAHSSFAADRHKKTALNLGVTSRFADVDVVQLEKFAKQAQKTLGDPYVVFAALPGQEWSDQHCAVVYPKNLEENQACSAELGLTTKNRLIRLLRTTVRFARTAPSVEKRELRNLQDAVGGVLEVLAREGRHTELESALESFAVLLDAWLEIVPEQMSPPERSRLFVLLDQYAGPLEVDFFDIASTAARGGQPEIVRVLQDAIARYAAACMHQKQYGLMIHYFQVQESLYYRCRGQVCLKDAGDNLDSTLGTFLDIAISLRGTDVDGLDFERIVGVLRFAIALTNAAIRLEQPVHAQHFAERIFRRREHMPRSDWGDGRHGQSIVVNEATVLDYVSLILIGWSLEVLRAADAKYQDAAKSVLKMASQLLPPKEHLIAVWELFHRDGAYQSVIDGKLGVSNWDVRDWDRDLRPGIVETRWGGGEWPIQGLRAALLLSREHFWGQLDDICPGLPNRQLWRPQEERKALSELASLDVLAIPSEKRGELIDEASSLIHRRARAADEDYLKYVLTSDLSAGREEQLRSDALESWRSHRGWLDAVGHFGISDSDVVQVPRNSEVGMWVPRSYLLEDNNWASGYGSQIGAMAGRRESIDLFWELEKLAKPGKPIDSLATLGKEVREAVGQLARQGAAPNIIVLPREERFAGSLFRKPLWEVEGQMSFGDASIGVWEGLHVLKSPYSDTASILILATESLLAGDAAASESRVSLEIENSPQHPEAVENREKAERAIGRPDEALPDSTSVLTHAKMVIMPGIGICDTDAMLKLSVERSDACYALPEGSDLYHRPSCPDIEFEDVEYVLRRPKDSDRKSCPRCRPALWDMQGRSGTVDHGPESGTTGEGPS